MKMSHGFSSCKLLFSSLGRSLPSLLGAALGVLGSAIATAATPSASEYRALGLQYRQRGQLPEAIAAFEQAVALEPENLDGRVLLGWTQHLAGQEVAAAETLRAAWLRQPGAVPVLNALGIVYLVQGELRSAVWTHTWAACLAPDNEIAWYNLALAFHRVGTHDLAIAAAERAAALEPTNPHPRWIQALALWDRGDRPAAQALIQETLNLAPQFGDRAFLQEDLQAAAFSPEQIQALDRLILSP